MELLTRIRNMMYVPVKAKYEYDALTEGILRFVVDAKQDDGEGIMGFFINWHRQAKKIFKTNIGKEILREYAKKTLYYKNAEDEAEKRRSKIKHMSIGQPIY